MALETTEKMIHSMRMEHLGLKSDEAKQIIDRLTVLLASYQIHYQRLRGYHWNLKGKHFFTLHTVFEKLYEDAEEKIDGIAERITALGGIALSGLGEILDHSRLDDAPGVLEAEQMMLHALEDQHVLIDMERRIILICQESGDDGSVDLLGTYLSNLEKQAWMVRAWLET